MTILPIASFIASFVAGIAALFAPCCITVLLPSYMGSIFSQRKTVLGMTGVFSLGLAVVFLPIGLGAGFLGEIFEMYHDQIYILGAIFLFVLGVVILTGRSFSLPWHTSVTTPGKFTFGSIFMLGVFSGFATSCCAPVLAGIVALSALPGSTLFGGLYAIAYVLGMVAPLFILSWAIDKTKITQKFMLVRRGITYKIFGKEVNITIANLLSGIIFIAMSALITYLALTGGLQVRSDYKVMVNTYAAWVTNILTGGAR